MSGILYEEIVKTESIAQQIYLMTIKSEHISQAARPGQFVNIKCCEGLNALLRRPISICSVDRERETFDIAFQVKGEGTNYLAMKKPGDRVDLLGPLGKPFEISPDYKKIAVVGGGIGVFPLLFLLESSEYKSKSAFLGFRGREHITLLEEFKANSGELIISTDDGSFGEKGLIIDPFVDSFNRNGYDIVYACGPLPMLKAVCEASERQGVPCQVSLEQRMGCGIGACLVCACKTRGGEGWEYSHVCKDGPVFWSRDVIFD